MMEFAEVPAEVSGKGFVLLGLCSSSSWRMDKVFSKFIVSFVRRKDIIRFLVHQFANSCKKSLISWQEQRDLEERNNSLSTKHWWEYFMRSSEFSSYAIVVQVVFSHFFVPLYLRHTNVQLGVLLPCVWSEVHENHEFQLIHNYITEIIDRHYQ